MEFAEDLKYQLCRMFLVNAGTNKSMPSNRFTMEDPRGGALVTGPNGVGKTMTLRLLPLFFGFPPNRLRGWPVLAAGCRHSPSWNWRRGALCTAREHAERVAR